MKAKISIFNNGCVSAGMLQLTPEIEKQLEGLNSQDSAMVKEFLCSYADNQGKFKDENTFVLRRYTQTSPALLPTVVGALGTMDQRGFAEYKEDFMELLPYFAYDYGDIVMVAKEFPRILGEVESARRNEFITTLILLAMFDEKKGESPFLCIGERRLMSYLELLAKDPGKQGGVKVIEKILLDYEGDTVLLERAVRIRERLKKMY